MAEGGVDVAVDFPHFEADVRPVDGAHRWWWEGGHAVLYVRAVWGRLGLKYAKPQKCTTMIWNTGRVPE